MIKYISVLVMSAGGIAVKIDNDSLFISIVDDKLNTALRDLDVTRNIEVSLFTIPDILDGPWQGYAMQIREMLQSKGLRCGMHGPFHNLSYHSKDSLIRWVSERRMRQGLQIASELGARFIVFHSTYSQFMAVNEYYKKWPSEAIEPLKRIARDAEKRGIVALIENIWDDTPYALKALVEEINSDFLKVCIDIGHLNIFSRVPIEQWLKELSANIAHFHLHNNFGCIDDHNALDRGTIDIDGLFNMISKYSINATYTIEIAGIDALDPSIEYLKGLGVLEK